MISKVKNLEISVEDLIWSLAITASHPNDLYFACKEIDNYPGMGTFLIMAQRVLNFYDVFNRQPYYEALCSYDKIQEALGLNYYLYQGYTKRRYGFHIQISFHIFESIYSAPLGVVPIPKSGERHKGIHAVAVYSWDSSSLYFANSWGTGWGDKGYGSISREYIDKYMVEAWIRRTCRVGPTRHKWHRLEKASNAQEYSKAWMIENPRFPQVFKYNGDRHRIDVYETISLEDDYPAFIGEIRNGYGLRLAWIHTVLLKQPRRFVIKELYVFPSFRRLGYASILEDWAVRNARFQEAEKIYIQFHEADAQPRALEAGRLFGKKHGYTWLWEKCKYPRLVAIGEKAL